MSKRGRAALLFFGVAAAFLAGCGKDPGEPSFPRVAAVPPPPQPSPEPRAVLIPPNQSRESRPPAFEEPLRVGGEVLEPVAIVEVRPDCRALVGAPQPIAVELILTKEGAVQGARVLTAVPESAKALILRSVKGWRFRPATFNGRPVPVYYTVALRCAGS